MCVSGSCYVILYWKLGIGVVGNIGDGEVVDYESID